MTEISDKPNLFTPPRDCWWDIKKAGQYLAMSEGYLRKCVRLKTIPFIRVGKKAIRFSKEQLDTWLQGGGQ